MRRPASSSILWIVWGIKLANPPSTRLTRRYFLRHNPAKAANVGGLLARYAGDEMSLFAKIEAKYGAPVLADDNSMRTPAKTVFDKLTDSRQYTGSHRTIHRDGPEPPSSGVRWFSPD